MAGLLLYPQLTKEACNESDHTFLLGTFGFGSRLRGLDWADDEELHRFGEAGRVGCFGAGGNAGRSLRGQQLVRRRRMRLVLPR